MQQQLQWIFDRFRPCPEEWFKDLDEDTAPLLQPLPCYSYAELLEAWRAAGLEITDALDVAFSAMLATVAGTKIRDDQVFLRVIGIAGTAKTTLCNAICVSRKYALPLSAQRGFHSGYTKKNKENCSLIPQMDGKTIIINEGDMLLKSPSCAQTLSEIRDIWSGQTKGDFRNGVSYEFAGLKLNFIIAGTPTLRELNESVAGDRFLDVVIDVDPKEKRGLTKRVLENSLSNFFFEANGEITSVDSPELTLAKRKTGGYVEYLRDNAGKLLRVLSKSTPLDYSSDCEHLGLMIAKMRTRPKEKGENKTEAELHIRLTKQVAKTGICLALALNKDKVDKEVMRRLAHVAEDTCYGTTFDICKILYTQQEPQNAAMLSQRMKKGYDDLRKHISTLFSLECIRAEEIKGLNGARNKGTAYRLTPQQSMLMHRMYDLLEAK